MFLLLSVPLTVEVIGRQLLVNGEPYFIRGVAYSPIPPGQDNTYKWWLHPEIYLEDLRLIKEMGANTVRLWVDLPEEGKGFLDACQFYGIKVIMGYFPPYEGYDDESTVNQRVEEFREIVERWKDHPAILMWAVGNEHNYYVGTLNGWYEFVEKCALAAKEVDPNHPVTTVNGGVSTIATYDKRVPSLDLWGANLYTGATFKTTFQDFAGNSTRPLWISEYGFDAINGTELDEEGQASYTLSLWKQIEGNSSYVGGVTVGGCIMEWCDEWWKAGDPSHHNYGGFSNSHDVRDGTLNEEWWGIVDAYRNPRKIYYTFQNEWGKGYVPAVSLAPGAITVYPNPFKNNIEVYAFLKDTASTFSAAIYDSFGNLILKKRFLKKTSGVHLSFDTTTLTPGVYVLVVSSSKGVYRKRLLKIER